MFATGTYSRMLVLLQFIFITGLVLSGPILPRSIIGQAILIFAVFFGIWAVVSMKQHSRLNIFPDVAPSAVLVSSGPYRFVRHPMYTALIVGGIGWTIDAFSFSRLFFLICLTGLLIGKSIREEKGLKKVFSGYSDYSRRTFRLFPYLW